MVDKQKPPKNDILGFSGKPHPQYQEELGQFIDILKEEGCRSYLEVGCRYGDTWHKVGMALPEGSNLVAVDMPGMRSTRRQPARPARGHLESGKYLKRAGEDLIAHGRDAHVIIANSTHESTIEAVRKLAPFDAILIDGDHSKEGVTKDWNNYSPMGRIVAFHDVVGDGQWAVQIRSVFEKVRGEKWRVIEYDGFRRGFGVVWRD